MKDESKHIQLFTTLQPDECASRLSAAIDTDRLRLFPTRWWERKPVVGRVTGSSLYLRKQSQVRNSFQPWLTATIKPSAGGTLISGKVATHPFLQAFMAFWFLGILLIWGATFVGTLGPVLRGSSKLDQYAWIILFPPLLLAFGIGLVWAGTYMARDDRAFLKEFLIKTLDAHPTDRQS